MSSFSDLAEKVRSVIDLASTNSANSK